METIQHMKSWYRVSMIVQFKESGEKILKKI